MADIVSLQELADAKLDAQSLERFINGDVDEEVLTRLSQQYPSLQNFLFQFQKYNSRAYKTFADMDADKATISAKSKVTVTNDATASNNGDWQWDGAVFTKSAYDPLMQAKDYTDGKTKNIEIDLSGPLYKLVDSVGNIIAYFDSNSGLFISDIDKSVQEYIKELVATSPYFATDGVHLKVVDNLGNTVAYIDADGTLNVANTINLSGKSIEQIITENSDSQTSVNMTMQTMLTNTTPQLKALSPIRTKVEAGTIQRMPFGIKTDYGLLVFFHSAIAGYDGDNQGSELWKGVVDIDTDFNASVRSTELFLAPDEPRGIVKHPMLGRAQDGRIILIFEKRLESTDQYTQYICYSSDEGLTFTTPVIVSVSGFITGTVLGSSGTILTLSSGRLVCPMYTKTNRQCGAWYSDDDGATWKQSALTVTPQIGEPSITLENDRILMSTRVNSTRKRYFFESKDNGESWSKLPLEIEGADCEGSIFYDGDIGVTMLSYVSSTDGTRTKYRFSLSHTKSKTYDLTYKPVADSYYIGYSQILKLDSGVYALVHEYAESFVSVNNNENSGILILSAKEVFNHVSRN